ncbi:MAG: MFS transporter, partial [Anaerotignum sp.]|nr:MFS transporter [Anaerotignum sp.]
QMIRIGCGGVFIGLIAIMLPFGGLFTIVGLVLLGLGCAPIYPAIVHSIPGYFGKERSQAVMGVQVAGAYVGLCIMPPLFGVIANNISVALLPPYLLVMAVVMALSHEAMCRKAGTL